MNEINNVTTQFVTTTKQGQQEINDLVTIIGELQTGVVAYML